GLNVRIVCDSEFPYVWKLRIRRRAAVVIPPIDSGIPHSTLYTWTASVPSIGAESSVAAETSETLCDLRAVRLTNGTFPQLQLVATMSATEINETEPSVRNTDPDVAN